MWDAYSEDRAPGSSVGRIIRIAILAVAGFVVFAVAGNQLVGLTLNVGEFGGPYTKAMQYSIVSGMVLAAIALVRVNFVSRHSIAWYLVQIVTNFVSRREEGAGPGRRQPLRYSDYHMSPLSFGLWQVTKVVALAPLFANLAFGMAITFMAEGGDMNLGALGGILGIPFAEIPRSDGGEFARQNVVPAIPALTVLVPPLLGAVSARLLLYVGVSGALSLVTQYFIDASERKPKFLSYISKIEIIAGAAIFWAGISIFFSSAIDFNTKYLIAGSLALGGALIGYGLFDRHRARVIIYPTRKHIYVRLVTAAALVAVVGIIVAVNVSIAEARKIEYSGPYIAQEIAVNREMAELNQISVVNYDVRPPGVAAAEIRSIVDENRQTLGSIRLWDRETATQKLKPELGQRNDIVFADTDILRFGGTMYWTASTTPVLPESLARGSEWFNEHLVYTHAYPGFKMLEADTGDVVADEERFFAQNRIYYGESSPESGGLFADNNWSAYRVDRTTSDEIDGFFYNGTGGIDVAPPASWMFEPTFMLSSPDASIHLMRYKDIHERMQLLYPYFAYEFALTDTATVSPALHKTGVIPVSDGQNTYWMMPLIAALDTKHVPWGAPFMLKLVGYALIDAYNGDVQVIVTGNDPFSQMFYDQYGGELGATREVPGWLADQIRYPEEMFIWKIAKFNRYHVTDPKTFIEARQFYDIPDDAGKENDISPYYIVTKPQGFSEPAFVGFQSLELAGSQTRNLVGYMIVENDLASHGKMTFYSVPLDSPTKLIGPTAAREALEKDREYKNIKTLLQGTPRVGENILYKIGEQEVYFIPVYTASSSGGVVSQIGTIAAVGAAVTGTFHVGLGDTPAEAFENYLAKAAGEAPEDFDVQDRIRALEKVFEDRGLQVVKPTSISAPVEFREAQARYTGEEEFGPARQAIAEFIDEFAPAEAQDGQGTRIFQWQEQEVGEDEGRVVNFGVLRTVGGIVESHYISIEVS